MKTSAKVKQLVWTLAKVGCYWDSPEGFHIASFVSYAGTPLGVLGYRLLCNREVLGEYATLKAAQYAAARLIDSLK